MRSSCSSTIYVFQLQVNFTLCFECKFSSLGVSTEPRVRGWKPGVLVTFVRSLIIFVCFQALGIRLNIRTVFGFFSEVSLPELVPYVAAS